MSFELTFDCCPEHVWNLDSCRVEAASKFGFFGFEIQRDPNFKFKVVHIIALLDRIWVEIWGYDI